jgi:hypothetical protein
MDAATWIGIATLTAAVVGLSLVYWQLREQRRALRVELGNMYVQRYWEIDDALLLEPKGTKLHTQHRHRYLRLFEDEFDAAALAFLDDRQWDVWHSVLDDANSLELVEGDLDICNPEGDRFIRLRRCIQQRAQAGRHHGVGECDGTNSSR